MDELKPCPFCKGKAHLDFGKGSNVFYWKADGHEAYTPLKYLVYCSSCCCQTALAEDTETAIMLWNRRAGEDG